MTTASPNAQSAPVVSDDEDKVLFRTPVESSKNGSVIGGNGTPTGGARSASLGTPAAPALTPSPNSFKGQDVDGEQATGGKSSAPATTTAPWVFPSKAASKNKDADAWGLADQVRDMKISDAQAGEKNNHATTTTSVLAPAAEITDQAQPHSRQSSAGDSSSFDSPAIPTPGQFKSIATENVKGDYSAANGAGMNGYGQYGYDAAEMANGINAQQMHPSAMSPLMASVSPGMPFRVGGAVNRVIDAQHPFGSRPEDYFGGRNSLVGMFSPAPPLPPQQNGTATYPTLNNQQAAPNPAVVPYGSPPPSVYNPGLMSPTMGSPTFIPTGYPPVHAPTPYSPYPGAQSMATAGFDMMAPLSPPPAANGMTRGPNQARHGYSASQPPALRDGNQGNVVRSTPGRQAQPRAQPPRPAPNAALNHAHSLSLPHTAYSPPLNGIGIPYGPMSPPPFAAGYYPGMAPQVPLQTLSPELLQAMAANMSAVTNASTAASQQAYNQSVQNALGGLQQEPQVMALIQQGGGPSANNRKLGLYKTELCRSWEEKGSCKYGEKCQFAHGEAEQRRVERHPKYKTEICRTFWVSGSCPYGKRCCFIHTELPANAAAAAANGAQGAEGQRANGTANGTQADRPDGRARSMSTNSDPNDPPSSLLARISARAQANGPAATAAAAAAASNPRSNDSTPSNSGLNDSAIAGAIARAYSAYGLPAGATSHKLDITPPEPTPTQPQTQSSTPGTLSGFSTRQTSTPSNGLGGHHRVSASVDFGRQGRNLGSDLAVGLGSGMGHTRNPSASSVVPSSSSFALPQLSSRTPLSGQSTPFGNNAESNNARSVTVGSSLLDHSPW